MTLGAALLYFALAVGSAIGAAVVFSGVMVALVFVGGPSLGDECGDRTVAAGPAPAGQFDARWDAFDDRLDAGQVEILSYNENEVSARARSFLLEHDIDEIGEVTICLFALDSGEGEVRGKVDVPILPDVTAKIRGTIDLSGSHPKLRITDIDVGSVPGFVSGLIDGPIQTAINEALEDLDLNLGHTYELRIGDGVVTITGRP